MGVYESKKPTKDGKKFYFRCYYKDRYGNNKQYESKKYKGVRECEKAERDFLSTVQYEDIPDYDISFEKLYYEWLTVKQDTIKTSTFYCLKKRTTRHILSFFENYKLHSIKEKEILQFKNSIINNNLCIEEKNRVIKYLKNILEYAHINYNFDLKTMNKLTIIKNENVAKEKQSTWNFWTYDEFKQFISVINDDFYYLVFNFLYFTGVRVGEFMALNWNDIDFENKILRINKTLTVKVEGQKYIITSPKTKNSIRKIDLSNNLLDLLSKHYEHEKKIFGFNKSMFVFGNIKHLPETTIRRYLDNYIKEADVKRITIHGFRHSHASLLINLGLDFEDVAERLGDTVRMVQDTYYHMYPQKKSNTVKALNNLN